MCQSWLADTYLVRLTLLCWWIRPFKTSILRHGWSRCIWTCE